MRIDDGYRVLEYGLLLAANEVEEGGLCWVAWTTSRKHYAAACRARRKRTGRPVAWRTVGKLGATARRVRYRMIGDINDRPDVLIVCVGGNDMLAGRSVREWAAGLAPVLDAAKNKAGKVMHAFAGRSIHHRCEIVGDDQPVLVQRLIGPLTLAVLFDDSHSGPL